MVQLLGGGVGHAPPLSVSVINGQVYVGLVTVDEDVEVVVFQA